MAANVYVVLLIESLTVYITGTISRPLAFYFLATAIGLGWMFLKLQKYLPLSGIVCVCLLFLLPMIACS